MKILKTVTYDIDIAKIRARYQRKDISYSDQERRDLLQLVDLFEAGEFQEAVKLADSWDREKREMIVEDIWDVLWHMVIEHQPHDNQSATVATVKYELGTP